MKEETIEPQSWSLDYSRMYGYKVTPNTNQSSDGKKVKNKSISLSLLSITLSTAINHANESQISKLCPSQPAILQIPLGVEPPNFFFIDPMNPVPSQFRFFSTQALRYHHMFSDFSPRFWGPNRSNPSPMVVAQTG